MITIIRWKIEKIRAIAVLVLLVFSVVATVPWMVGTVVSYENWWDEDWTCRKYFTIGNSTGADVNYQIEITTYAGSGSDSGSSVYLNSKAQADFDDVRFVAWDNTTVMDAFLMEYNATRAIWSVEVPSNLTAASVQAWVYYGHDDAPSVSNITNTFPVFADDFGDASIDTSKWDNTDGGATEADGWLTFTSLVSSVKRFTGKTVVSDGYVAVSRLNISTVTTNAYEIRFWFYNRTSEDQLAFRFINTQSNVRKLTQSASSQTESNYDSVAKELNITHTYYLQKISTAASGFRVDSVAAETITTNIADDMGAVAFILVPASGTGDCTIKLDWAAIKKYVAVEPTMSGWSSEETTVATPTISLTTPAWTYPNTSQNFSLIIQATTNLSAVNATLDFAGGVTLQWLNSTGEFTESADANYYCTLVSGSKTILNDTAIQLNWTAYFATNYTNGLITVDASAYEDAEGTDTGSFYFYTGWQWTDAYNMSIAVLESNVLTYEGFEYIAPATGVYDHPYCWDTAFNVLGIVLVNQTLANSSINALFAAQNMTPGYYYGMIPNAPDSWGDMDMRSQTPLISAAVWEYYQRTGDLDSLTAWYDNLEAYYDWWNTTGTPTGAIAQLTSPCTGRRSTDSLTSYFVMASTGWDNHPTGDYIGDTASKIGEFYYLNFSDVVLSSAMALFAKNLADISDVLGYTANATIYSADYEAKKDAINEYMWDDTAGVYKPVFWNGTKMPLVSGETFFPLWANVANSTQADLLRQALNNASVFNATYGIPSVSISDAKYYSSQPAWMDSADTYYWRGPQWSPIVYAAYIGMKNYGFDTETARIADKYMTLINASMDDVIPFAECYNASSGAGRNAANYSWTAGVFLVFSDSESDLIAPTYSGISANTTIAGDVALLTCKWEDEYLPASVTFGTNNTGVWANLTVSLADGWGNVTLTLNSTVGVVVGYEWWCVDENYNANNTGVQTVTTTADSTNILNVPPFTITSADALSGGSWDSSTLTLTFTCGGTAVNITNTGGYGYPATLGFYGDSGTSTMEAGTLILTGLTPGEQSLCWMWSSGMRFNINSTGTVNGVTYADTTGVLTINGSGNFTITSGNGFPSGDFFVTVNGSTWDDWDWDGTTIWVYNVPEGSVVVIDFNIPGEGGDNGGIITPPPPTDTDHDGTPDSQDTDDDGDGIPDLIDPHPLVPDTQQPAQNETEPTFINPEVQEHFNEFANNTFTFVPESARPAVAGVTIIGMPLLMVWLLLFLLGAAGKKRKRNGRAA